MKNYETTEQMKVSEKELFIKKVEYDIKQMGIKNPPWYRTSLSKKERKLPELERERIRQGRWYDSLSNKTNILV